jgi:hypothetical protein
MPWPTYHSMTDADLKAAGNSGRNRRDGTSGRLGSGAVLRKPCDALNRTFGSAATGTPGSARKEAEVRPAYQHRTRPVGAGSGSPLRKRDWLMCGGQFVDKPSGLLLQPVNHLFGIDRTLQQCGILGCELPLLLL